ncbi:MAG: MarR family transcriptional regulator [Candidatus Nitronauta litoralis]|uniref:MarR family transcriptional regulator n=1 Tax=Candidatus Nitronauta litoralis TaxID=2705533 RepID=A0A7T0BW12_9BACT|nr:MAG: MarR family transcriptional regulator [Candidatus Nitronauta litoralis]
MPKRTPKAEALRHLILNLLELTSAMESKGQEIVKPHKQTLSNWKVLTAAGCDNFTVSQIARRMGLSRQAVQKIANSLVEQGLARYVENPDHKTSPIVALTKQGHALDEAIVQDHIVWSNAFSKNFTLENLTTTAATLKELSEHLEAESKGKSRSKGRPKHG